MSIFIGEQLDQEMFSVCNFNETKYTSFQYKQNTESLYMSSKAQHFVSSLFNSMSSIDLNLCLSRPVNKICKTPSRLGLREQNKE